jgi:hypothetical protein
VSGSSAILVGGSSCVFMATPSSDAANHTLFKGHRYSITSSARASSVDSECEGPPRTGR